MFKKLVLGSLLAAASLAASAEQYLIDVRSPEEFAEAHADGAVNIPVDEVSQKSATSPKTTTPTFMFIAAAAAAPVSRNRC